MLKKRLAPIALMMTWIGILVAYWPSGCSTHQTQATVPASPEALQLPPSVNAPSPSFLPHPAFALAQAGADQSVTIADIAERATPSVVNIASRRVVKNRGPQMDPFFRHFFGPGGPEPQERHQRGLGSGVVYSDDGLILTNNHVIDGADEITVTTADGTDYDADVVGTDEKSDVAVLRLKGNPKNLIPISVGDSAQLRVGDVVLAIGNPFGLSQTVTMGIVSAKGRLETGIVDYADFIQTDAAINPGNSGGALVNMQGELVGINTAIFSRTGGYQGIGFAIPSNMARQIAQSLVEHGKVSRGWLGVAIQDINPDLAAAMSLPDPSGVLISDVEPGSPAEKAGLMRGDVVLSVNGTRTNSSAQLRNRIAEAGGNQQVELAVLRAGKTQTMRVMLGELKSDKPEASSGAGAAPRPESLDGLAVEPLTPSLRGRLNLPPSVKQGVVVTGVAPGSAAAESGLAPGDVIVQLNKRDITDVSSFRDAYRQAGDKKVRLLLVYRDGRTRYVALNP